MKLTSFILERRNNFPRTYFHFEQIIKFASKAYSIFKIHVLERVIIKYQARQGCRLLVPLLSSFIINKLINSI